MRYKDTLVAIFSFMGVGGEKSTFGDGGLGAKKISLGPVGPWSENNQPRGVR